MRAPLRGARILLLYVEMNSRRVLAAGVSLIVGLVMEAEHACEDVIREGLDLEVVVIDGLVEFAAGVFDAIFRPGNVGLEVLELLGGTKIGVGFGHRHQAAELALQLGLRALILTEGSGVVDVTFTAVALARAAMTSLRVDFSKLAEPSMVWMILLYRSVRRWYWVCTLPQVWFTDWSAVTNPL